MYLVFDVESVVDWDLLAECEHAFGDTREQTIERCLTDLREKQGVSPEKMPFVPAQYHLPVAVVLFVVDENATLIRHRKIVSSEPEKVIRTFWRSYRDVNDVAPCIFVTFNGKGFDMPVIEVCSMRYGVPMVGWLNLWPQYASEDARSQWNNRYHMDLRQVLYNPSARVGGSLNFWSELVGAPGKICTNGAMVADLFKEGKLSEIGDYCMADVMSTYAHLVRLLLVSGDLVSDAGTAYIDPGQLHVVWRHIVSRMVDQVVQTPDADGECVRAWIGEWRSRLKNEETAKALAQNGDSIPF